MMNKLYLIWIVSTSTSEELWAAFKEKLTGLLDWKAVVMQWKVCAEPNATHTLLSIVCGFI